MKEYPSGDPVDWMSNNKQNSEFRFLDVGCGLAPHKNATDTIDYARATICHDLMKTPWPIPDNSFDYIYSRHCLEHLPDFNIPFDEIYRVAKDGATIEIIVPWYSGAPAHHPEHRLFWNYHSFDLMAINIVDYRRMAAPGKARVEMIERHLHFYPWEVKTKYTKYEKVFFKPLEWFADTFPIFYQKFICGIFAAYEIQFIMRAVKDDTKISQSTRKR